MHASAPTRDRTRLLRIPLLRARRGVAALEFALIAPLFVLTVLGVMGVGLLAVDQALLDRATADAARLIRTGALQQAGGAEQVFTARLCADLPGIIPCNTLEVDVQAGADFAALNASVPLTASGTMQNTAFTPGGPGQAVLVEVGYPASFPFDLIAPLLGGGSGTLLLSSVVFQNEMY